MLSAPKSAAPRKDFDSSAHSVNSGIYAELLLIKRAQAYLRRRLLRLPADAALLAAWQDFYASYDQSVRRFAIALGMQSDDFEECVQDVWAALVGRLPIWSYKPTHGRFRTWLYQIVRHKAADRLRRRRRQSAEPLPSSRSRRGQPPSLHLDPVAECERRLDREAVHAALYLLREEISPLSYQVFHLRRIEERSVGEVAELVDVNAQQVRALQFRAEQRFRECYREFAKERHFGAQRVRDFRESPL